jgi:methylenetetrahydrofolate--tRNA-(uracil-5-)-methyltransferase
MTASAPSVVSSQATIHIIGGGLAGCEAAWQAAQLGLSVILYEMRPERMTPAHQTGGLAELVCSNSFRSDDAEHNAVGLLHEEMRRLGSIIMRMADKHQVPAGAALAVDREGFSQAVEAAVRSLPNVTVVGAEQTCFPSPEEGLVICASGPLTSGALAEHIQAITGQEYLAFFDAIAPIVHKESIDFSQAWFQSRYDKPGPGGTGKDYINCPMDEAEYNAFLDALLAAEKTEFKEWEKNTPYFEACLPIEVMAERGRQTLTYGPMKPVGLTNPHTGKAAYAVVQLRQDNALGTLYNMVGFQTKLKYGEQQRIFRMIPGLEEAEFARLGGIHRNSFIQSPRLLDAKLRLKSCPHIRFAGQITGVEGYVESAAMGLMAGRFAAMEALGMAYAPPPPETAHGALLAHITGGANAEQFQPMNVNFGLFPPLMDEDLPQQDGKKRRKLGKKERAAAMSARALRALDGWKETQAQLQKAA